MCLGDIDHFGILHLACGKFPVKIAVNVNRTLEIESCCGIHQSSMTLAVTGHILHHVLKTLCMSDVILLIQEVNGLVTVQVTISLHR